jgi:hypothetical protein
VLSDLPDRPITQVEKKTAGVLKTIGEVASRLAVPQHRVAYVVRTRGIRSGRVGPYRVFSDEAVARIKAELERIDQRPALTPAL